MKSERLQDALENVREDYLRDAEETSMKRRTIWVQLGAAAACLLILGGGLLVKWKTPAAQPGEPALHTVETAPAIGKEPVQTSGQETTLPEETANGDEETYAVYTDKILLPEEIDTSFADMIGCLVYRGAVYTQDQTVFGDLGPLEDLIGDYVGMAKGNLEEWSTQEDWAQELASTMSGAVHTVKGYDPEFRLCIVRETEEGTLMMLVDNFDGIGLNTGKDLFEDRLRIPDRVTEAQYLRHQDWDWAVQDYRRLDLTQEQLGQFLETVCESKVVRLNYEQNPHLYDEEVQGHLFLRLEDGITAELRLLDGGYVGFQELPWVFVRMPGEIFDTVINACQ